MPDYPTSALPEAEMLLADAHGRPHANDWLHDTLGVHECWSPYCLTVEAAKVGGTLATRA